MKSQLYIYIHTQYITCMRDSQNIYIRLRCRCFGIGPTDN